jgi:hypothetical protein
VLDADSVLPRATVRFGYVVVRHNRIGAYRRERWRLEFEKLWSTARPGNPTMRGRVTGSSRQPLARCPLLSGFLPSLA